MLNEVLCSKSNQVWEYTPWQRTVAPTLWPTEVFKRVSIEISLLIAGISLHIWWTLGTKELRSRTIRLRPRPHPLRIDYDQLSVILSFTRGVIISHGEFSRLRNIWTSCSSWLRWSDIFPSFPLLPCPCTWRASLREKVHSDLHLACIGWDHPFRTENSL